MTRRYFGFVIGMSRPLVAADSRKITASASANETQLAWCAKFCAGLERCALNALAQREPYKSGDCDWRAGLGFGFLDRLRDRFLIIEDEALIQQANFLVEGLQAGFDDLVDYIGGLALRFGLLAKHRPFAFDGRCIQSGRVDRLRIGGGNMHCDHAAEDFELIVLAGRFKRYQ